MATPHSAGASAAQKFQYQKERPPNFEEKVETLSLLIQGKRTEDDVRMALDQSNFDADAAFSLLEDDTKWTFRSVNKPKTEVQAKEAPKKERKQNPEEGQKPQRTNFKDKASKPRADQKDAPIAPQDGQERRYRNKDHRIRENGKEAEADGANGDAKPYTRTYRNKKDFSRGEEGQNQNINQNQNTEGKPSQRQFVNQRPNKFQPNRPRGQFNPGTGKEDEEEFLTIKMVIRSSPAPENATGVAAENSSAPVTATETETETGTETAAATAEVIEDTQPKTETPAPESAVVVAPVEENTINALASTEASNAAAEGTTDNQEPANPQTATNIKLSTKSSPKAPKSGSSPSTAAKPSTKRAPEAQPKVSWVIKQKAPSSGNDGDAEASATEAAKQEEPAVQAPVEVPKPVPAAKEPKKTAAPKEKPQFQFKFGSLDSEKETPAVATTAVVAKEEVSQIVEAAAPAESTPAAVSPAPATETQAAPEESPAVQPTPTAAPAVISEPEQYVPTKTEQPEITQTNIPIEAPQIMPPNTSILTPGLISANTSGIPSLQATSTSQENAPQSATASLASSSVVLSHPGHQSAPTISSQLPASQRNFANTPQNTQAYTQPRATNQGHNPGAQYQQYRNTMANQPLGQVYYQTSEGQGEDASDITTQSPSSNPNQLYMSSHVADYGKTQMYAGYGDASQGYMSNPSQAVANGSASGKPANRPHNQRDKYPPTGNPAEVPGGMPHPAFPYFPIFFPPPYQYPYFAPYQGPPPPFNGGKGVGGSNFKGGSFPPAPGAFPYPIPYPMAYDEEGHGYPPHFHPAMYIDPNQQAVHQGVPKGPGGNQGAADINPRGKPQPPMGGHGADYGQPNPYGQPNRFQAAQQQSNVGQYGNYGHPGAGSGAWNH